ncbi:hypothetical protein [Flavobacterium sp.]|uniref:hypothetical protein n=1 Tax=Flavobacterium sp. TaxID=239 RepID=UPI003753C722
MTKYIRATFYMPNGKVEKPLCDFVVLVDSIEKMTAIDFFPKLHDKNENTLEKRSDYNWWSFN